MGTSKLLIPVFSRHNKNRKYLPAPQVSGNGLLNPGGLSHLLEADSIGAEVDCHFKSSLCSKDLYLCFLWIPKLASGETISAPAESYTHLDRSSVFTVECPGDKNTSQNS